MQGVRGAITGALYGGQQPKAKLPKLPVLAKPMSSVKKPKLSLIG